MDSEYLKLYYKLEREHWWFRIREKILRQQLSKTLPPDKQLKILNVGAAMGRTSEMLMDFGEVTSVEFDHNTCQFLRDVLHVAVIEASVTSLPFAGQSFDIVCAFDVLEHVDHDEEAIKELHRVCRNNGLLYVTTPAYPFLWGEHDLINHHYRRYTADSLKKLLGTGFHVRYLTYFNCLLFLPTAFYRWTKKWFGAKRSPQPDFAVKGWIAGKPARFFLENIFKIEVFFLRYLRFPFGVSILARAVKE